MSHTAPRSLGRGVFERRTDVQWLLRLRDPAWEGSAEGSADAGRQKGRQKGRRTGVGRRGSGLTTQVVLVELLARPDLCQLASAHDRGSVLSPLHRAGLRRRGPCGGLSGAALLRPSSLLRKESYITS